MREDISKFSRMQIGRHWRDLPVAGPGARRSPSAMKIPNLCAGTRQEASLQLRPAPQLLELALYPSSRLRRAARCLVVALLAYTFELGFRGHPFAALALLLFTSVAAWRWRAWHALDSSTPRHLRCTSDGRLSLVSATGNVEEVSLQPESLRFGRHLLLVLRGSTRRHRVLLGPDNLAPGELAALNRRLPMATVVPGTALHSLAAHRGRPADPP